MTGSSRHSIKVPRLFKEACKIAKLVREEGESLKELVYSGKHPNIKAIYALVVQTLQHENELDTIFKKSELLEKEKGLDPWLARVLITELIWGKKRLSGESKPVKTVLSYKSSFIVDSGEIVDAGNKSKEVRQVRLPRYVRVNTLHLTVEQAVDYFRDEGWLLARQGDGETLFPSDDHFRVDAHIPDVLVFPPGTELYHHPMYKDRTILLQDKASCLAAHLLAPPPGSTVLDMCAAPGMKTTHLAACMQNKGILYAVEKNPKRYKTLCSFIEEAGATCAKSLLEDSIQLTAEKLPNVEYILVDPSCSGTGMVSRPKVGDSLDGSARLRNLVGFQRRLLLHALTTFPKATRVVYSTCSLLPEENEGVVASALEEVAKDPHTSGWCLTEDPLPGWKNRGCEKSYPGIGKHCLYSRTETDLTNGFFLALFERTGLVNSQELAGCQRMGVSREMDGVRKGRLEDTGETTPSVKTKRKKKGNWKEEERKKEEGNDGGEPADIANPKVKRKGAEDYIDKDDTGTTYTEKSKKRRKGTEEEEETISVGLTINTLKSGKNRIEEDSAESIIKTSTKKKRKMRENESREEEGENEGEATITAKTKKNKGKRQGAKEEEDGVETTIDIKSKRKRNGIVEDVSDVEATIITNTNERTEEEGRGNAIGITISKSVKKKKKKRNEEEEEEEIKEDRGATDSAKTKEKRKGMEEEWDEVNAGATLTVKRKKKKKKREGEESGVFPLPCVATHTS